MHTVYRAPAWGIHEPTVTDAPLEQASEEDTVFVEGEPLLPYLDKIDTLVLYRWNRRYPHDLVLDLPLDRFTLVSSCDMEGYSHEKITKEIYKK